MDRQEIKQLRKEIEEILHLNDSTGIYVLNHTEVNKVLRSIYKLLREVINFLPI